MTNLSFFLSYFILSLNFKPRLNGVTGMRLFALDWTFPYQGIFYCLHSLLDCINMVVSLPYNSDFPEVGKDK